MVTGAFVLISALVFAILLLTEQIGWAGSWCWIRSDSWWVQFLAFYLPLVISLVVCTVSFWFASSAVKKVWLVIHPSVVPTIVRT